MPRLIRLITESIRAVPAVRYALGVSGIIATVALVRSLDLGWAVAVLGAIVMLGLMTLLVVFARLSSYGPAFFYRPAIVLTWTFVMLSMACAVSLATSVFFNQPLPLRDAIIATRPPVTSSRTVVVATKTSDYHGFGTVLDTSILKAEVQNRGPDVLFILTTYPKVSPFIEVDYNQNGLLDPELDRGYALSNDGSACVFLLRDLAHTTYCGGAKSKAAVSVDEYNVEGHVVTQIQWLIPKTELSTDASSVHVVFRVLDSRDGIKWWFLPSDTFAKPLKIRY